MASPVLKRIKNVAEQLYEIRQQIREREEENKAVLDKLRMQRDELEAALITDLRKNGLPSIATDAGIKMTVYPTKSLEVVNEVFALKWALEHKAVSVNKLLAKQIIKDLPEIPSGFAMVEQDSIRITNSKTKDE